MSKAEPYENALNIDELRKEVRRLWDEQAELVKALRDLPEVPHGRVLKLLSHAGKWPEEWRIGKRMQREHGLKAIPPKTEYELGAGLWFRIRTGLLSQSTGDESSTEPNGESGGT